MNYACEGPEHEGERRIVSSANAFYQRLEYRSAHGDERPLVRTLAVYCRACVEREVRRAHGIADGQGQLV